MRGERTGLERSVYLGQGRAAPSTGGQGHFSHALLARVLPADRDLARPTRDRHRLHRRLRFTALRVVPALALLGAWSTSDQLSQVRTASAGGPAAGKAQHQPLTISKTVGPATPQLAQAACTGEVLRSVLCEFIHFAESGVEEVAFAVRLLDATISGHRLVLPDGDAGRALVEELDLTYRRIEWEHRVAKTMAADAWG